MKNDRRSRTAMFVNIVTATAVSSMTLLPATSKAETHGGICKLNAAKAIEAISSINGNGQNLADVLSGVSLVSSRGPVETYESGLYRVQTNSGSDDFTDCSIMSLEYMPHP